MIALKQPSEDYAMSKPEVDDVREVQRRWIKHRDATCNLIVSVEPKLKEQCLNWLTAQREQELQGIIFHAVIALTNMRGDWKSPFFAFFKPARLRSCLLTSETTF
ncbi:lysozyme inhibitor LprI family protein [Vibrio sinaloensis]|nr:lysozyme inhibitor LprI family protein [Vibrio sinaloensis]